MNTSTSSTRRQYLVKYTVVVETSDANTSANGIAYTVGKHLYNLGDHCEGLQTVDAALNCAEDITATVRYWGVTR
jgi:hypothetical protein